jgi:uncharacterized membrane protein
MLVAFGIYWTAEGLGMDWPGGDLAILALAVVLLVLGRAAVVWLRRRRAQLSA